MANRRIEVHQYREVLYRIRQGETLRSIDRAKLMNRRKSKVLVEMVQPLGWLDPSCWLRLERNQRALNGCQILGGNLSPQ